MSEVRKRILFIGEAVTLAHVVRPAVLAAALDPQRYAVTLACDPRYDSLFGTSGYAQESIYSIPSTRFTAALAKGQPVYDTRTLERYVQDDTDLLQHLRPDLVIGDFRLSLSVSARLAGIPYWTISNAYWSPRVGLRYPMPEHPLVQVLGPRIADAVFAVVRPAAFAVHARPLNAVRRHHGLPSLGHDLRTAYTDADRTLYADIPDFVPMNGLAPHEHWLGAVLWSPAVPLPEWWDSLPADRPVIYLTLGSSGNPRLLSAVFATLGQLPISVIAATTVAKNLGELPSNVFAAPFLPGDIASARASLVICNGGSPTTQQAFAAGVPVIGIAGNLDQHLNMLCVEKAGLGKRLRSDAFTIDCLATTVHALLRDDTMQLRATILSKQIQDHDTGRQFAQMIDDWCNSNP